MHTAPNDNTCFSYLTGTTVCPSGTAACYSTPPNNDGGCSGCYKSSGPCMSSNTVCYDYVEGTTTCPEFASACTVTTSEAQSSSGGGDPVSSTNDYGFFTMQLQGLNPNQFHLYYEDPFVTTVSNTLSVPEEDVSITYVQQVAGDAPSGVSSRRLSLLAAAAPIVARRPRALAEEADAVEVGFTVDGAGSAEALALSQAVDDGSFIVALADARAAADAAAAAGSSPSAGSSGGSSTGSDGTDGSGATQEAIDASPPPSATPVISWVRGALVSGSDGGSSSSGDSGTGGSAAAQESEARTIGPSEEDSDSMSSFWIIIIVVGVALLLVVAVLVVGLVLAQQQKQRRRGNKIYNVRTKSGALVDAEAQAPMSPRSLEAVAAATPPRSVNGRRGGLGSSSSSLGTPTIPEHTVATHAAWENADL